MNYTLRMYPRRWTYIVTCLSFLCASVGIVAQNTDDQEDEVFELTPFEVTGDEVEGYRATSTLAGTRMRMDLEDVGSSVSVFTEKLMEDLGAVDNETLLSYGLGTEVGGARGNFVNPNTEGLENANLVDPQSNNRIRGLTSADSTRNYFKSDVPWDGYNTNRIDVQRGANSILFGLGSPAGIINNTTESASFRDEGEARLQLDKFGSIRGSASLNRVVLEDELAVRVNLLYDQKKFRQDPAYEDDERFFVATTYRPKGLNSDTTTTQFSFNYESGSIEANRPRFVVPLDMVSPYYIPADQNGFVGSDFANGGVFGPSSPVFGPAGRTFNPVTDEETIDDIAWLASAPNGSARPIFAFDTSNPGAGFSVYEDGLNSRGSFLVLENQGEQAVVVNDGDYYNPLTDTYVRETTQTVFQAQRLSTIGKQRVASDNGFAFPGFWRDPSLATTERYDFMNNLIDGNNKLEQQNFDVLELQMQNTFFDNKLGYQLSYFKQSMDARQDANLGAIFAPAIQVEANSTDPLSDNPTSLLANPNAGRAYIDFELRLAAGFEDVRDREAAQAQLFATLDARDHMDDNWLSRFLGKHDFTGLLKKRELERYRREFRSIGPDEATIRWLGGLNPPDPNLDPDYDPANLDPGPGARMVRLQNAFGSVEPRIRMYLDAQGPNLTRLQPFSDPVVPSGQYPIMGFDATPIAGFTAEDALEEWIAPNGETLTQSRNPQNYTGTVAQKGNFGVVHATDSEAALEYLTMRRFYDKEEIDSQALVWTGSFLDGAIVGMYGWREDDAYQESLVHRYADIAEDNDEGETGGPVFDIGSPFVRENEGSFQSRNWSAKVDATRLLTEFTGLDDNDLPFRVSLLYNEGEVQSPQPGRRNVLLQDLPPATGRTIDRSLVVSSRDGRYSMRLTSFDTVQANADAGSVAASENWRIEQVMSQSVGSGVAWIEAGNPAWTNAVLDNGDDVDDDNELDEVRSQHIRDAGFDDVYEWGQSIASAYRDFEAELFTSYPAARSWITSGGPGEDSIGILFPDDTVFIEDNSSSGMELEFVARPTENWNLALNVSQTEVLRSRVFSEDVNNVLDLIVGSLSGPAGDVPLWGPGGQMGRARIAPFLGQLITNRALLGTPTGELREWKYNLITDYEFTEGRFDGFGIGGGVRYEDSQTIGFPPIYVDPATGEELPDRSRPDAALSVRLDSPYTDDARTTADLWLKWGTNIGDKVDYRIQLNVFNVFNDEGTVPLFVNPDGTIGTRGIREGRSWQVTNTFRF